jgi:hypothetical protein
MSRALALLCLIPLTVAVARADEKPAPVKLVQTWSGEVKLAARADAPKDGFITEKDAFAKFWKAFRGDEKLPDVDFTKELVLVAVGMDPNKLGIGASLDAKGDLKVLVRSTLIAFDNPTTVAYQFATVPRTGIKSINGKDVK